MADVKKIATREAYGSALAEFGKDYDFVVLFRHNCQFIIKFQCGVLHTGNQ